MPSRLAPEIFAADIEERRLRVAGWTAAITIERKYLVVAIGNRKWPSSREKSSPNVVRRLGTRFHLRCPSLIRRRQSQIRLNIPTKIVGGKSQSAVADR